MMGLSPDTEEPQVCPSCESARIVEGRLLGQTDAGLGHVFRLRGLRLLSFCRTDLPVPRILRSCVDCGLLWSWLDARRLQKVVETKGSARLRKRMQPPNQAARGC